MVARKRGVSPCLLFFLGWASIPAIAETPPDQVSEPGRRPIDEIVVVGRWENPLGKSMSASSGVFGQTEISERPILRTGELLEFKTMAAGLEAGIF